MELNQQLYSVSELAEKIGVPRTTITDWLAKYERFIDTRVQGKRRFYTARSADVLAKVAELRSSGRSLLEIDAELEHLFAILPTVESEQEVPANANQPESIVEKEAPPDTDEQIPASDSEQETAAKEDVPPAEDSFAVVKQEAEVAELVNAKFADLCRSMEEMNQKTAKSNSRLKAIFAFSLLLIVFVIGAILLLFINLSATNTNNQTLSGSLVNQTNALNTGVEHITSQIGASIGSFTDELADVKTQLKTQQEEFDAEIAKQVKLYEQGLTSDKEAYEAKLALQKELFAAEQLKILHEKEKLEQENKILAGNDTDRVLQIKKANEELIRKDSRIKELQDKYAELELKLSQREEQLNRQFKTADGAKTVALQRAETAEKENEKLKKELVDLQQKLQQQNNIGEQK